MSIEKKIIQLHQKWDDTPSFVIANNIDRILIEDRKIARWKDRMEYLAYLTSSTKHAAYSWMNNGRAKIKIPFIKLCVLADKLNMSVEKLMEDNTMEKFCIDLIKGDTKKTLAEFDTKDEAFAAGEKYRADHPDEQGSYVCNGYRYNADGNRWETSWRQYKKW